MQTHESPRKFQPPRQRLPLIAVLAVLAMIVSLFSALPNTDAAPGDGISINHNLCSTHGSGNPGTLDLEAHGNLPVTACYDTGTEFLYLHNNAPYWVEVQDGSRLQQRWKNVDHLNLSDPEFHLAIHSTRPMIPPGGTFAFHPADRSSRIDVVILPRLEYDSWGNIYESTAEFLVGLTPSPAASEIVAFAIAASEIANENISSSELIATLGGLGVGYLTSQLPIGWQAGLVGLGISVIIEFARQGLDAQDLKHALTTYYGVTLWIHPDVQPEEGSPIQPTMQTPLITTSNDTQYRLPYEEGVSAIMTGQPGSSHHVTGLYAFYSKNAYDFVISNGRVTASAAGVVHKRDGAGGGNEVIIDHGRNECTRYSHLADGGLPSLPVGAGIAQGQFLGNQGDTGNAFGVHLHFSRIWCDTEESLPISFAESGWTSENIGLPDADADGISDTSDACPFEFGLASEGGCPDVVYCASRPGYIALGYGSGDPERPDWYMYGASVLEDFGWNTGTKILGDWDGDGTDEPAYISTGGSAGDPTRPDWYFNGVRPDIIDYGYNSWEPIVGNWDGSEDGSDEPGWIGSGEGDSNRPDWYLYGMPTIFDYGWNTWEPITGDWDGDNSDEPGVVASAPGDPNKADWYLYGSPNIMDWAWITGTVLIGDWDGDNSDEPGVVGAGAGQGDPTRPDWYMHGVGIIADFGWNSGGEFVSGRWSC